MDDVVVGGGERERQVGADADRNTHLGAARDRDGRAHGDHAAGLGVTLEDLPAFEQVGGPRRGRDDGHVVSAPAQRVRGAPDVLVHVVGLRPCERRYEADAHARAA